MYNFFICFIAAALIGLLILQTAENILLCFDEDEDDEQE
jgi:hypothetical protein